MTSGMSGYDGRERNIVINADHRPVVGEENAKRFRRLESHQLPHYKRENKSKTACYPERVAGGFSFYR